jgi:hypothetical protein
MSGGRSVGEICSLLKPARSRYPAGRKTDVGTLIVSIQNKTIRGKTAACPLYAGAYGYSRHEIHQIRVKTLPLLPCIYCVPQPCAGSGRILCAGTGMGYCEESPWAGAFFSLSGQTMMGDYSSGPPGNALKCCLTENFL